jgi:hypothetical protein
MILKLNWDVIQGLHRDVRELVLKKMDTLDKLYADYYGSISKLTSSLDENWPITITSLSGDDLRENRVPWKALLNPDLSTNAAEEYEFLSAPSSMHGYRFTRLGDKPLGLDPNELYLSCHSKFGKMMSQFERLGDEGR